MKEPQIDIYATATQGYLNKVGWKKKFLRYWGTETVDGIEVLKKRHYYYPSISDDDKKLFQHLNVYEDLKSSSMSGISSAWMYLNAGADDLEDYTTEAIVQQVDFDIPDGKYAVNISRKYKLTKGRYNKILIEYEDPLRLFNTELTDAEVITLITNNYQDVLDNYTVEGGEEDSVVNVVATHVMLGSDAFDGEITEVVSTYAEYGSEGSYEVKEGYSITIQLEQVGAVTGTDAIIVAIENYVTAKLAAEAEATALANATRSWLTSSTTEEKTDDYLWYKGQLRASVFDPENLKTADCISLVQGALDTGYKKKSVPWYKKLLGLIIFVVAFYFSGGTAAATLGQLAYSVSVATLAVSLASAAMAAWGDELGASAVGEFASKVSVLSTFLGIAAVISNISNMITAAMKEVTTKGIVQTVSDLIVDKITALYSSYTVDLTLTKGIELLNKVFSLYSSNKLESLQSKLADKSNVLAAQEEEMNGHSIEEQQRLYHMSMMFSKGYTENIQQDMGVYEIDYLYEPTAAANQKGTMHIGNICRRSFY